MKKTILTLGFIITAMAAGAQHKTEIKLWPEGAAEENGLQEVANADGTYSKSNEAILTIMLPPAGTATGQAVVICPGGGYTNLAMNHEGWQVAEWMNSRGIAAAVLKYRMPNRHSEIPRSDVLKAISTVRENATQLGIDPGRIGVMGFSAGGHLASTAATHFTSAQDRPDFAILIYPVITMDETFTHRGSRESLIGPAYNAELVARFSNEKRITESTPPTFIAFSDDDRTVPPKNGTSFYDGLKAHGVAGELHIYPTGGHGWGWRENFAYRDEFLTSLSRWLGQR